MTEQDKIYFNQYPEINEFIKIDSMYFFPNAIVPAKVYSFQMGLPIEVLNRETLIEITKLNTEPANPEPVKQNKKSKK